MWESCAREWQRRFGKGRVAESLIELLSWSGSQEEVFSWCCAVAYLLGMAGMARAMGATLTGTQKCLKKIKSFFTVS